jgi:hypothetical protein
MSHRPVIVSRLVAAACTLALASCSVVRTTSPRMAPGLAADSPAHLVNAFAWAWTHRDTSAYLALLTDDFEFVLAAGDSVGNAFPNATWDLEVERVALGHLFVGGGANPPARNIQLGIDNHVVATPDPRPGRTWPWHQVLRVAVALQCTVEASGTTGVLACTGYAGFHVVRGDSAALSPDRAAAGGADSTRWYLQRWEDETLPAAGPAARALPAVAMTWGDLKASRLAEPLAGSR